MLHRGSSYDQVSTQFSPEGRLFQVEYALEAVRRGTLAVGLKSDAGAVLVIKKKMSSPLMVPESINKIYKVDEHIGCAISGLHADSRVLVNYARVQCQEYRLTYDEPALLHSVVRTLADLKQRNTQLGGLRPFGSALLFIAVDKEGPQCMLTSPVGTYNSWKAKAIGLNEDTAQKLLEKEYKDDLSLEDLMKLGIKAHKESSEEDIEPQTIEIAYVETKEKQFKFLEKEKTIQLVQEVLNIKSE
ncbi:MAG: archaeal proteasome endopeptidase complex subunit alpha [Promethearchaeota archaeon]